MKLLHDWVFLRVYLRGMIGRIAYCLSPKVHSKIFLFMQDKGKTKVNLRTPMLFHEKIEWLKYYRLNQSSLAALTYDKFAVRDYVRVLGLEHILIPIYGVWDSVGQIPWEQLPEAFVLKATSGWSHHVFCFDKKQLDIQKAKQTLCDATRFRTNFWFSGATYTLRRPMRYMCEQPLCGSADKLPPDYKIYCFHGVPQYILFCWNRHKKTKLVFLDTDWNLRKDLFVACGDVLPPRPEKLEEMLEYARILSEPFPFARIDLYYENGKIYFGEVTLTPSTPGHLVQDTGEYGLRVLGEEINMERTEIGVVSGLELDCEKKYMEASL